jgi:hypothetical protein
VWNGGSIDKVEVVLVKDGDCGLQLADKDGDVVVVGLVKGGVVYNSLLVRKDLVVKQLLVKDGVYPVTNAAECLSKIRSEAHGKKNYACYLLWRNQ